MSAVHSEQLLAEAGLAGVPFIFLTASRKQDLWRAAQAAGAAGFFEKPYNPERLLAAIASAMTPTPPACQEELLTAPACHAA